MKVYELKINEEAEAGVTAISLVESPATEEYFIKFNSDPNIEKLIQFKIADKTRHIVMGAAMVPNKQIYRRDEDSEFYVYFTEDTIRQVAEKFMLDGKINSATFEHTDTLNGMTIIESWIVEDPEKDKSSAFGLQYPAGSWIISMKVNNPQIWEKIESGELRGFSVEGIFTNHLIKNKKMDETNLINKIVEGIKSILKPEEETKVEMGSVTATHTESGESYVLNFEGETLSAGAVLMVEMEGEMVPAPAGEYALETGEVLVVIADGVLEAIVEAEEMTGEEGANKEEILDAVKSLLEGFMAEFKTAHEELTTNKLEEFRNEFNTPGAKKTVIVPGKLEDEPKKFKTMKQKIAERKEAAGK